MIPLHWLLAARDSYDPSTWWWQGVVIPPSLVVGGKGLIRPFNLVVARGGDTPSLVVGGKGLIRPFNLVMARDLHPFISGYECKGSQSPVYRYIIYLAIQAPAVTGGMVPSQVVKAYSKQ